MNERETKAEVAKHLVEAEATLGALTKIVPNATADGLTAALSLIEYAEEQLYQSSMKLKMLRHKMRNGEAT